MEFIGKAQIKINSGGTLHAPASEWKEVEGDEVEVKDEHLQEGNVIVLWDERNEGQTYLLRLDEHDRVRVGNQSITWSKAVLERLLNSKGVLLP